MNALIALLLALRGLGISAQVVPLSVSAYSDYGITASGAITEQGHCACGPSFSFGTVFVIDGQFYTCVDRGGLVTDGHLDLYWPEGEASALQFGRRNLAAIVIDHVKPLSKGGAHLPCNLRPICASCNSKKKATWPYDWQNCGGRT